MSMDSSKAVAHNAGDMVVSDHGRSVYITGHYYDVNSSTGFTAGPHSGYVKKLDADGNPLWSWNNTTTQTSLGGGFIPTAIALDPQQNVIVVGSYSLSDLNASITFGKTTYKGVGNHMGAIVMKFDSTGTMLWQKTADWYVDFNDVDIDQYGNIYILGNATSGTDFGRFYLEKKLTGHKGRNSLDFVAKLSPSGYITWAKPMGEAYRYNKVSEHGHQLHIAVDQSANPSFYTAGFFTPFYTIGSTTIKSKGGEDALLMKFDSSGTLKSYLHEGASSIDFMQGISIGSNSDLAVTFTCKDSSRFNGKNITNPVGLYHTYLLMLDTALHHQWYQPIANSALPAAVTVDNFGRIAVSMAVASYSSTTVHDFLFMFDKGGKKSFSKQVTIPVSGYFPGFLPRKPGMPGKRAGSLFFGGTYSPEMKIDKTTVKTKYPKAREIGFVKLEIPNPCTLKVNLGLDTSYCGAVKHTLSAPAWDSTVALKWWNADTVSKAVTVTSSGKYWLQAKDRFCTVSDTITIAMDTAKPKPVLLSDTVVCPGVSFRPNISLPDMQSFVWLDGPKKLNRLFRKPGTFRLELTNSCGSTLDSIQIDTLPVPRESFADSTFLCDGKVLWLKAHSQQVNYEWNGVLSSIDSFKIDKPGSYGLTSSNVCGTATDTIVFLSKSVPGLSIEADWLICKDDSILLKTRKLEEPVVWLIDGLAYAFDSLWLHQAGKVFAYSQNECGLSTDSLYVMSLGLPYIHVNSTDIVCPDDSLLMVATSPTGSIEWVMRGNTILEDSFWIDRPRKLTVISENKCGTRDSTFKILAGEKPQVALGPDTSMSLGKSIVLRPQKSTGSLLWSEGGNADSLIVVKPGRYWVQLQNGCGLASDTVNVYLITGFEPTSQVSSMSVFPNPAKHRIWVECQWNGSLEILDINGGLVFSKNILAGNNVLELHVLAPGSYLLRYQHAQGVELEHFMVR